MAPRANWKGYLRLSLVSCPVALYPATTDREKVHFHRLNKATGNRVRIQNVDEESREPVESDDIVRGYEVSKGRYLEVTDDELEAIQLEGGRIIDIVSFVPRNEIDQLYNVRPYYIAPDGDVGLQAYAVIRKAIEQEGMVALGRFTLTSREHMIALEPRGKGIMGTLLRYPYEVRKDEDYFGDIPDVATPKDMVDLAVHIVRSKAGHFKPEKFEDRYEEALKDLLKRKAAGEKIEAPKDIEQPKVINLMDALKRSLAAEGRAPARKTASPAKRAACRAGSHRRSTTSRKTRKAG
jgi:DNA end-binding protein Ku